MQEPPGRWDHCDGGYRMCAAPSTSPFGGDKVGLQSYHAVGLRPLLVMKPKGPCEDRV